MISAGTSTSNFEDGWIVSEELYIKNKARMTWRSNGNRRGPDVSSDANSWRLTDTTKGFWGPADINTKANLQHDKDAEISPRTTRVPKPSTAKPVDMASIAPWEAYSADESGNQQNESDSADTDRGRLSSANGQPGHASAQPHGWTPKGSSGMSLSAPWSYSDNSTDTFDNLSPASRPQPRRLDASEEWLSMDQRRPSVASASTGSSSGDKGNLYRGSQKKLKGFFGDEVVSSDSRKASDTSLARNPESGLEVQTTRGTSLSNAHNDSNQTSQPSSPTTSRPRSPQPSSEVTPWLFQDLEENNYFGSASTVRSDRAGPNRHRLASETPQARLQKAHSKEGGHHHRFHLPGHKRLDKSKEDLTKPEGQYDLPAHSTTYAESKYHQEDYRRVTKAFTAPVGTNSRPNSRAETTAAKRPSSPTPSTVSSMNGEYKIQSNHKHHDKRSLFNRITGRHKGENPGSDSLKDLPGSSGSLQQPSKSGKPITSADINDRPHRNGSVVDLLARQRGSIAPSSHEKPASGRRETMGKIPFRARRGFSYQESPLKDPNLVKTDSTRNEALWNLDTDLSHMEGIIDSQQAVMPTPAKEINIAWPGDSSNNDSNDADWDAPDSWAVKRQGDENLNRLQEIDEEGVPQQMDDSNVSYCVRIFRVDSTFATLSMNINTTVADIIQQLGKKTFLQDDLDNYLILMRKHDTSRQLHPQERPLAIQKRLLEQAGYNDTDRLDEIGREDNSFLCRFTFLPAKMCGSSSLDKDPTLSKMQKYSYVDLSGHNLITIPLGLYAKAAEIQRLNLSRNLSLDVPKDFIQACQNLREIVFTGNEAWRLPKSFSLATKLQLLDVSNNRLEQLEHAELHKLQNLGSLRLTNNKLSQLPQDFGQFKALRNLSLASNSLVEVPDLVCDIKTLVDLDVSFNAISALPDLGRLSGLEKLTATNNKLSGPLPETLKGASNLKEIDVRFNNIENIDMVSQLPRLESLMAGHNSLCGFEGAFSRLRILYLDHNPLTRFGLATAVPSLSVLSFSSCKLSQLPEELWGKISGLTKLLLDKNHFAAISPQIGRLQKLDWLSLSRNQLNFLPPEIGCLGELRYLDVRENNLDRLPQEMWFCRKLETLNVSSNILDSVPKPTATVPNGEMHGLYGGGMFTPATTPGTGSGPPFGPSFEEFGRLEDLAAARRGSQVSNATSMGTSPSTPSQRKGSVASVYGQKGRAASILSKTPTEGTLTPLSRKDSILLNKMTMTFAGSLKYLYLADNRLVDEVFDELSLLPELRVVNLSHNYLNDIPSRTIRRWQHLAELYLSGNDLSSLPTEDLEEITSLKVLHINSNKFQTLPAELAKLAKLVILDVGSNNLKYNVSNWPYDWNWNWNMNLKYLNFSANRRLEIKPSASNNTQAAREGKDLTDFSSLPHLRILGLMDVTLMVPSVPDETEDRRVRTSGSMVGSMSYGMADSLGRNEHLSIIDMVVPAFQAKPEQVIVGMFDGQNLPSGGSKIAKYLHENLGYHLAEELGRLSDKETPADALRRTYLALNKDLAAAATHSNDVQDRHIPHMIHRGSVAGQQLTEEDLNSGAVATVLYLHGMDLYVSNVGDAEALLIHTEGNFKKVTRKHDPAEAEERQRIREAGGYVSGKGKLNDILEVSRAFGYTNMMPAVIAAPHVAHVSIKESDEMILIASRELWEYLTPDFAVDVARQERGDLMRAAQKLRDLAIAFGATSKIMVMLLGISDLKKREKARYRTHSMSMGPTGTPDDYFLSRRQRRGRDAVGDSKLARLDKEVEAPTGEVSIVFTDIKNSTLLWETYPNSMQSAIKMHNDLMRRQLRLIGGYEVKTEGDAFMVAFPTPTSALLWCFTIQSLLLEVEWPQDILNSVNGQEVLDADENVIFRGLSVRMGIHWGYPVCEVDPVTKRMDYFGPMVNRAARVSAVADGGQITVSSDFIAEVQRLLENFQEAERSGSAGSEETSFGDEDVKNNSIRRELGLLQSQGFEVQELGERRLKGLENPEYIYLIYPHSLASRLIIQQQRAELESAASQQDGGAGTKQRGSQLTIDTDEVWALWNVSLRLEMLCSSLENPDSRELKPPETALLERMKNRGGEITDRFFTNFVEHQISRIETCITTLAVRNLIRPFRNGMLEQACAMGQVLGELTEQLRELKVYKEQDAFDVGGA